MALVAAAFKGLGLRQKDKVAVLGVNCPDWMITMQVRVGVGGLGGLGGVGVGVCVEGGWLVAGFSRRR